MDIVLELLKIDLGIMHNKRDGYFNTLLLASKTELEGKGLTLDLTNTEDQMLLSDFAAWVYRKRQEDMPLSKNLQWRIRNKAVRARTEEQHEQKK